MERVLKYQTLVRGIQNIGGATHFFLQYPSKLALIPDTHRSRMAKATRTMQAPAIAPPEDGCRVLKNRLSPPAKWSHGIIMTSIASESLLVDVGMSMMRAIEH